MPYANIKGADQPAHLRSLISTFVVRCLDSTMPLILYLKFQDYLVAVAEQTGLSHTWSKISEDTFWRDVAQLSAVPTLPVSQVLCEEVCC